MSVQSDCEMMSVDIMEIYAEKHHLTGDEAIKLFHKYQVYEKIMIQHEYLHQVSTEEVLEFVEKIITEGSVELVVYHGSCFDFDEVDLSKSHNRRDFGKGFYTTILKEQSKAWAYRLSLREKKEQYFVYEFLFDENTELNVKRFDTLSEDWLEFIKENREKGGLQHNYDVVIGPVDDDNTMETVQLYIANILTSKEAVERLRYNKVNNQVPFHTENALKSLKLVRREHYGKGDILL